MSARRSGYDFHNNGFKTKHQLYIAEGQPPPPTPQNNNSGFAYVQHNSTSSDTMRCHRIKYSEIIKYPIQFILKWDLILYTENKILYIFMSMSEVMPVENVSSCIYRMLNVIKIVMSTPVWNKNKVSKIISNHPVFTYGYLLDFPWRDLTKFYFTCSVNDSTKKSEVPSAHEPL
jgi:hypothetical protein